MKPIPILNAQVGVNGALNVWCDHCRLWHHHGAGEGHRVAHCTNPLSPYKLTGYYLRSGGHTYKKHGRRVGV